MSTIAHLEPYLDALRQHQFSELWLMIDDGPSLSMLVNGDHAWLMYLRNPGDIGFSSRNPNYTGLPDAPMEFILSNGQRDEYPASWALPLEQAIAVCEYFIATQGGRSPEITWHDDACDDGQ